MDIVDTSKVNDVRNFLLENFFCSFTSVVNRNLSPYTYTYVHIYVHIHTDICDKATLCSNVARHTFAVPVATFLASQWM